jgi:hypothetical protein
MNLTCPRCGARVRLGGDEEGASAWCTNGQACGATWGEDGDEETIEWVTVGTFNVNDLPR